MKFHVYGLFGGHNFGDELFSKYIIDVINQDPDLDPPYLVTNNKTNSSKNVENFIPLEGYPTPNKGLKNWWSAFRSFRISDGLLFGGGGLFNEVFLRASIPGKAVLLATAKLNGVPYVLHGLEIGYVGSRINKALTKWSLKNAEMVICRNVTSIERAKDLYGVEAELGADINQAWLNEQMSSVNTSLATQQPRTLIVNLQHSLRAKDEITREILEQKRKEGYHAAFLINETAEKVAIETQFQGLIDDIKIARTVQETIEVLKMGDAFLTERFHFTMAALHANKPTTIVVSSTKVKELLNQLEVRGGDIQSIRDVPGQRPVVHLEGSAVQAEVVNEWANTSRQQLLRVIQTLKSYSGDRSTSIIYLFHIIVFYLIFIWYYLLDKFFPLRNELDLSKT